ncbi:MAG: ATP-dependent helicase [Lentisphaerae bacterium]|nr:ATP-dependent helicase [Lentisphaerota bacterium]
MSEHLEIKVAISADFLKAFSRIPQAQQKKVREFVDQFQNNPASPGYNYETIHGCVDPNLRSARIDQTYRAIILKPESGNLYMLLWVDKHDEAYAWASKRKLIIHPDTGGIQVIQIKELETPKTAALSAGEPMPGLFAAYRDRQLRRLGVPDELMESVRHVFSECDLDAMEGMLAQEAYESLSLLAGGFDYEEVVREYERETEKKVDTRNFVAALDNLDSQRRFKVVEDALELQELLNSPLEQWRVFLHPAQRRFVEMMANGPVRVLGGAGTGKTVVAVHRAKWLASALFQKPTDRILFTTYTRNLAADIQEYLRAICPAEVLKRIDVINLDAWVSGYLKKVGYGSTIAVAEDQWKVCWDDAMNLKSDDYDLSDVFYRDEWDQVIQSQGISNLTEYFRASRAGRGRRLSREMKKAIWPVFEEYRALLSEKNIRELPDAYRDCRQLLAEQGKVLGYRAVIVDEAQDFGQEAFKLIRLLVPEGTNDLFIVGDAHQRIYGHPIVLGRCGIKIQGRSRKLRVNYRTTDETRRFATSILTDQPIDDLDGGADNNKGYLSLTHGPEPKVICCNSLREEEEIILSIIKQLEVDSGSLSGICITCRTNNLVQQYADFLARSEIPYCRIEAHSTHDQKHDGVRLATMHRVKGIEFDHIILVAANEGIIPLKKVMEGLDNTVSSTEAEAKERSLLYVALTRARKRAFITSFGESSSFLRTKACPPITPANVAS